MPVPFLSFVMGTQSFAQDAPPADEPTLKLVEPGESAEDRERVKLSEDSKAPASPDSSNTPASATPEVGEPEKTKLPESIQKMSEAEKNKLRGLLRDASTYLGGIRVQEAFAKLVDAEAMAPDYAAVWNLKGAAYTKLRDFERAEKAFGKAVELDPTVFMSRFNLNEIYFVRGEFETANRAFAEMLASDEELPPGTEPLIEFKIVICKLMLDDEAGARDIMEKFDFLDDHPAYYFCNAAIHFSKDEEDEAKEWMESAEKIYDRNQINIYTDSLIEVGWLENLQ